MTRKGSGKWELAFKPGVDTTDNVVYLVVTYENRNQVVTSIGTLTVTSSDSSTPVYADTISRKIGDNNYISFRRTNILCNSQVYNIEVTDTTSNRYVTVDAFYTGVTVS